MKVRRFLPAMLALILLVSIGLVGCSSSNDDSKEGKGSSKGDVVVDIFQFKVEFKDQFKKLAEKI